MNVWEKFLPSKCRGLDQMAPAVHIYHPETGAIIIRSENYQPRDVQNLVF